MTQPSKIRRRGPAWIVALLLAFAVSGWGLQYKLSLYLPQAGHARGPVAKLLSQKERPVASAQLEQTVDSGRPILRGHHPIVTRSLAACILVGLATPFAERRPVDHPRIDRQLLPLVFSRPSGPRPPPIIA